MRRRLFVCVRLASFDFVVEVGASVAFLVFETVFLAALLGVSDAPGDKLYDFARLVCLT